MILAVNLGVCPDYCYGNLRHLFAYNNILWEYHSPRETRHPNTQNLKAPRFYGIIFFSFAALALHCSQLNWEPELSPIIMSGKLKVHQGLRRLRGLNMSRGWRIATSTANIADINLTCPTFLWRLVAPVLSQSPPLAGLSASTFNI